MKTRIITGFLFTLGVLALLVPVLWIRPWPLIAILGVALGGSVELWRAGEPSHLSPQKGLFVIIPLLPLVYALLLKLPMIGVAGAWTVGGASHPLEALKPLGLLLVLTLFGLNLTLILNAVRGGLQTLTRSAYGALSTLYLAVPLCLAVALIALPQQPLFWLSLAFFSPWFCDVCAYFAGSLWGRRRLIPKLSPKKTVAGFLGGAVGCAALLMPLIWLFNPGQALATTSARLILAIGGGLLLGVVAQLGDWLASCIKRQFDLKDFGQLFPGHGGILDRFDSVLFTLPIAFIFFLVTHLRG